MDSKRFYSIIIRNLSPRNFYIYWSLVTFYEIPFVFIGYKKFLDVLMFMWGSILSEYVPSARGGTVGITSKVYIIRFEKHITYEDVEQKWAWSLALCHPWYSRFPKTIRRINFFSQFSSFEKRTYKIKETLVCIICI